MNMTRLPGTKMIYLPIILSLFFLYGCEDLFSPSDLVIKNIQIEETYSRTQLYLPDGVYVPDNPDFDFDDPETWTGNMAQYIQNTYHYTVTFRVTNSGGSIAYDSEIDMHYIFDNGEEIVETFYMGDIDPHGNIFKTVDVFSINKQLVECAGDAYWYD